MTILEDTLLQLLQVSMGNSADCSLASHIHWWDVMELAEKQGLLGIAFDAIESLPANQRPDIETLMEWLGQVSNYESIYEQYEQTVTHVSRILSCQNLIPIIMKGYGCSLNYPKPNHRPCGDIDIFVTNHSEEHNKNIVTFANQILVNNGASDISNGNEHHYMLSLEGYTIENHETILDVNTHKSSRFLETLLEQLVNEGGREIEINGTIVYLPSVRFNSIHLLRHMANDFATAKTTLRHVLDWATFVSMNQVDWKFVHKVVHETNMNRFLDAINGICVEFLGYSADNFPVEENDVNLRERVLADIFHPEYEDDIPPMLNWVVYNWKKTKRLWTNRWKYRIVYNESLWSSFCTLAKHRINRNINK